MMKKILSKLFILAMAVFFTADLVAQVPQGFNFQAVARDAEGEVIANSNLGVRITLLQGSEEGNSVYTETQSPETNGAGLFQLVIGEGTSEDDFGGIDWSTDNYYVKLEIDPAGGEDYEELGTTRLLSVPYALLSQNVVDGISVGEEPITEYNLNSSEGDTSFIVNATGSEGLTAIRGNSSTDGVNYGVTGTANSTASNPNTMYGVYGNSPGEGTGNHLGVIGSAINDNGTGGRRYGLYGQAKSQGRENIGGFGIGLGPGDGEVVLQGEEVEGNFGGFNIGFVGFARDNLNGNIGIRGYVYGDQGERSNRAVSAEARTTAQAPNIGVQALVSGSQTKNIGYVAHIHNPGTENRGIELNVGEGSSNIGIISNADTAAVLNGFTEINGDLKVNGAITETSDRNLKENIQPLQNGLGTIMQLKPTTYNFRGNGEYNGLKLSTGLHYGLIAQEVEVVLPSLVSDNTHFYKEVTSTTEGPDATSETEVTKTMDYKTMNYTELIPILIKGMQEQQAEIEQLKKEIEELKKNK